MYHISVRIVKKKLGRGGSKYGARLPRGWGFGRGAPLPNRGRI